MNEYDYEPPRGQRRRQPDLDDNDFGREPRGRRDSDWADDLETRADGLCASADVKITMATQKKITNICRNNRKASESGTPC